MRTYHVLLRYPKTTLSFSTYVGQGGRLLSFHAKNEKKNLTNPIFYGIIIYRLCWQVAKPRRLATKTTFKGKAVMVLKTKTYFPKADKEIKWYVVDAEGQVLGRLASRIAQVLRGKHHPRFTPHADLGFRVAVINAEKVVVTGNKAAQKTYFRHSGYPGGDKHRTFDEQMAVKPAFIISNAVKGMLPKNHLGRQLMKGLKVYAGPNHPHQAQAPEVLPV